MDGIGNFEQTLLQDGKLHRQLHSLIVAHLRDNNFAQAATAVSSATMTPFHVQVPPNRLLELVAKGLAAENAGFTDLSAAVAAGYGSGPAARAAIDFGSFQKTKGMLKSFPRHEMRHLSDHKNVARCARFSPDGRYFATGSADTSIKLFEVWCLPLLLFRQSSMVLCEVIVSGQVSKVNQLMLPDSKEGSNRVVVRSFYDHTQPINDLDFHPQNAVLISGSKDQTIKFFDYSKASAKRAFRVIQDTHNVRSVAFHPSGTFLLAGTDHPIPHLYDVNSSKCYISANAPEFGVNAAINQVRYSSNGGMYVSASKDGTIRLWDGVSANCIRSIVAAHTAAEITSANFTKDQRYILSCGKDSSVKLWDVGTGRLVKQYSGSTRTQLRCPAVFNDTEEFVLSIDEPSNEIVIWDAQTTERVAKLPSTHNGAPHWIEHSPIEAAFVTCGSDRAVRYWRERI